MSFHIRSRGEPQKARGQMMRAAGLVEDGAGGGGHYGISRSMLALAHVDMTFRSYCRGSLLAAIIRVFFAGAIFFQGRREWDFG
jgi:NAD(P)H-dependent flavin oxidoreductase YrpB (nitropropane dioxygenase family)